MGITVNLLLVTFLFSYCYMDHTTVYAQDVENTYADHTAVYSEDVENTLPPNDLYDQDCETTIFTNDMVPLTNSELKCKREIFRRSPSFLAAYDCCAERQQNTHCRMLCLMRSSKLLREDGTWDRTQWIRALMADFGPDYGPHFAAEVLECLSTYGPYKPSENCHGIETHLSCIENVYFKECRELSHLLINTYNFDHSSTLKCDYRTHHLPTLFLEHIQDCLKESNSTYMLYKCYIQKGMLLNRGEGNSNMLQSIKSDLQIIFGKQSDELIEAYHKHTASYDVDNIFREATEENFISVLATYVASAKEAYYESCGDTTNDWMTEQDQFSSA